MILKPRAVTGSIMVISAMGMQDMAMAMAVNISRIIN
jgi:hypothetical protein